MSHVRSTPPNLRRDARRWLHRSGECDRCRCHRDIDLDALVERVGPDYSLWNRRTRCRITKGCRGWNVFMIGPGWHHKACDAETEERWMDEDMARRRSGEEPDEFQARMAAWMAERS